MNILLRTVRHIPKNYYKNIYKNTVPFYLHKNFYSTYYAKSHEKIQVKDNIATLGISDHARSVMGDIIFVDNNYEENDEVEQGEIVCEIESVKACSELYLPTNGKIFKINKNVMEELENGSDFWILKYEIEDDAELEVLLTKDAYLKYIEENRE